MMVNDRQYGRPLVQFTGTQAAIEALPDQIEGALAYATDIDQIGVYTGAAWVWYSATPTGKYRQFVYNVVAGDLVFIVDDDGHPLFNLLDLE